MFTTAQEVCQALLDGRGEDVYSFLTANPDQTSMVLQGVVLALAKTGWFGG